MTQIAQIFLGNVNQESSLEYLIKAETYWTTTISSSERQKSRIRCRTSKQVEIGIIKNREQPLCNGDLFRTDSGQLLLIQLEEPKFMVLDLTHLDPSTAPGTLVSLGHVLGNHHYPIALEHQKIYVQLIADQQTLEKLVHSLQISGLKISYQLPKPGQTILFSHHTNH